MEQSIKLIDSLEPIGNCRERCLFIKDLGSKLGFPWYTISTALYVYHRYFDLHPSGESGEDGDKINMFEVCICCLHFAGKLEETVERLRDVVVLLHEEYPELANSTSVNLLKPHIFHIEQQLLLAIDFDFKIEHPHGYMLKLAKLLDMPAEAALIAWRLLAECYMCRVCIKYSLSTLAVACLQLAFRVCNISFPSVLCGVPINSVLLSADRWVKNCLIDLLGALVVDTKIISASLRDKIYGEVERNQLGEQLSTAVESRLRQSYPEDGRRSSSSSYSKGRSERRPERNNWSDSRRRKHEEHDGHSRNSYSSRSKSPTRYPSSSSSAYNYSSSRDYRSSGSQSKSRKFYRDSYVPFSSKPREEAYSHEMFSTDRGYSNCDSRFCQDFSGKRSSEGHGDSHSASNRDRGSRNWDRSDSSWRNKSRGTKNDRW